MRYEKKAYNGKIWGGIVAMIGSTVWFIGGLSVDIMYSYPPILFIFGIIGLIRGIIARNNAQKKTSGDVLDEDF